MFEFLKRWQKQRRREKQLNMKYERDSKRVTEAQNSLVFTRQRMQREKFRLDLEFQKRNGTKEYIR